MPELAKTIDITNGTISIKDNALLEQLSREIAHKSINEEKRLAKDATKSGRPRGGRTAALQRQALPWSLFKRQFTNVGIIKSDGSLATTGAEKATEVSKYWGKTFSAKPIDLEKARAFAKQYAVNFELGDVGPPSEDDVLEF